MLRSREKKFQFKQKKMTNVGCFHGQHFLSPEVFKIPLVLLSFAITFKGINTIRG